VRIKPPNPVSCQVWATPLLRARAGRFGLTEPVRPSRSVEVAAERRYKEGFHGCWRADQDVGKAQSA
jgi:hypothetical protein